MEPAFASGTPLRPGIYPIVDADACEARGLSLDDCARAVVDACPPILQLRAKDRPAGQVARTADGIVRLIGAASSQFVINDRADVALAVGAHGVHVGQDDLPARALAQKFPHLLVGLSTHNEAQLLDALGVSALSYVALGPIFPTSSKKNADPCLSTGRLKSAYEMARGKGVPLVAIGGITDERLREVTQYCDLVAVISLILPEIGATMPYSHIRTRCEQIQRAIVGAR